MQSKQKIENDLQKYEMSVSYQYNMHSASSGGNLDVEHFLANIYTTLVSMKLIAEKYTYTILTLNSVSERKKRKKLYIPYALKNKPLPKINLSHI